MDLFNRMSAKGTARSMYQIGSRVESLAKNNAPISPAISVINRDRANTGRRKFKRRKASATSGAKPGGIVRSIKMTSDASSTTIFVPRNSEAGTYAGIIHDDKGKTWRKRGLGTVAKGPQADDKYISRGVDTMVKSGNIHTILSANHQRETGVALK